MRNRRRQIGLVVAGGMAALLAGLSVAAAALPPYWQRSREIERIVGDPQVQDALGGAPIVSVTWTEEDRYEVRSEKCAVTVTIVDVPQDEAIAGPRQFDLEVGAPDCQ